MPGLWRHPKGGKPLGRMSRLPPDSGRACAVITTFPDRFPDPIDSYDLTLWSTGEDVAPLERVMNRAEWANEKEISINSDTILFELFIMSAKQHDVNLKRKSQSLLRTVGAHTLTHTTYFRDTILNWIKQVSRFAERETGCLKVSGRELLELRGIMKPRCIYQHLLSTFDYGADLFITVSGSTLSSLNITQNRALRLINGVSFLVLTMKP
ncbi:hypothetical protein TNCT_19191 [Trichonephila clavata]|uniref:Uncharacterized protein n=1 Tax=Trichonephila clavata TaxID=2740835 RepID=A0A8X6G480_TRICU|nr:hypothetical protein TNCT_19191 [Trichonephila clavata]